MQKRRVASATARWHDPLDFRMTGPATLPRIKREWNEQDGRVPMKQEKENQTDHEYGTH